MNPPKKSPRRIDPSGNSYGPFHDVQIAVNGPGGCSARRPGEKDGGSARQEKSSNHPSKGGTDPWPAELSPDLEDVDVAVVTDRSCAHQGREEKREGGGLIS
jgi:phospholipase D1/2